MNLKQLSPQILVAYETLGLTIAEIAEQQEVPEGIVVTCLKQFSKQYQGEDTGQPSGRAAELISEYETLARFSEDDGVRERALKFLIDEEKGRNDIPKEHLALKKAQTQMNAVDLKLKIDQFNTTLAQTRKTIAETIND